ncbi:OmpA family protein [Halodurantibacterium flavum]|uniref:OmpA family protein n=1 Tax=Halodurantibacterium flavum TaxID=1382802 RepID=A0ABW4SAI7_9RHOB
MLLALCLGGPLRAEPLTLPFGAQEAGRRHLSFTSQDIPLGPWRDGGLPTTRVEGLGEQIAWRFEGQNVTLGLLAPLRADLEAKGYEILFECATRQCGGFDFRYALDLLPEPEMHVDLGDFRFLSAQRATPDGLEAVTLMVSRSNARGYLQMVHVSPTGSPADPPEMEMRLSSMAPTTFADDPWGGDDPRPGEAFVLDGVTFGSGGARLEDRDIASVAQLAEFLKRYPDAQATLVGHSDASGPLAANIDLSRQRAEAVQRLLVEDHAIPASRLSAEGVGYLSPRDDNATEEGRARNRRVEALITLP